jgi:hypothetical protein
MATLLWAGAVCAAPSLTPVSLLGDAFRLDAGVVMNVGKTLAVHGKFTGLFSHDGQWLGGSAGFRLSF